MASSDPSNSLDILGLASKGASQHETDSQGRRTPVINSTGEPKILLIIRFEKVEARSCYKQIIKEFLRVHPNAQSNGSEELIFGPALEATIDGRFPPEEYRLLLGDLNGQVEDFKAPLW